MSSTGLSAGLKEAGTREERRARGIYYTPIQVARCIADWAIQTSSDTVLDPSFGGCAFLQAAKEQLSARGAVSSENQIYGVDSDPEAMGYLTELMGRASPSGHFKCADFLQSRFEDYPDKFAAVIGNPPYIRHHALSEADHRKARAALAAAGWSLSDQASYWAYFVLHSISFVAPGGRLAFVLPGVFAHADYAKEVRLALQRSFDCITALFVDERLFPDALEETIILLAEGRSEGKATVRVGAAASSDLRPGGAYQSTVRVLSEDESKKSWLRGVLGRELLEAYDTAAATAHILGDLAIIRIGEVTGANRFFIMTPEEFKRRGIRKDKHSRPIVTRASQLPGLSFTSEDLADLEARGERVALMCLRIKGRPPDGAKAYIAQGEEIGLNLRTWCAKRAPWYRIAPPPIPDAFLLYMSWNSPRLVINQARIACTNTIHGVTWRTGISEAQGRHIAIASLTTLSQLSAELEGRSYGGGVLKLEPSEAARLRIPTRFHLDLANTFAECSALCHSNRRGEASEKADALLLLPFIGKARLNSLKEALYLLRRRRSLRAIARS